MIKSKILVCLRALQFGDIDLDFAADTIMEICSKGMFNAYSFLVGVFFGMITMVIFQLVK